jgi:hypothetical protein
LNGLSFMERSGHGRCAIPRMAGKKRRAAVGALCVLAENPGAALACRETLRLLRFLRETRESALESALAHAMCAR